MGSPFQKRFLQLFVRLGPQVLSSDNQSTPQIEGKKSQKQKRAFGSLLC